MKFRNTLILLAVLLVLGAYVLLVEIKRPVPASLGATPIAEPPSTIISYESASIRAVRLVGANAARRTELIYKDDGKWYLTAPVVDEADQDQVIRLVESFSALTPQRVLTETTARPSDYELDPPAMRVEIEEVGGVVHALRLGAQNASRTGYYAQVGDDKRIYLLATAIGSDVQRYLDAPPIKPTPTPTEAAALPPRIPPPPTATPGS